ncbi:MAG TPA: PIG-L family deacetylase [Ktedonobacterales bacterium]
MEITSLEQIDRRYRHIYLSPHFDDAALSCGGSIGLQTSCGLKALVITAFAGVPPEDQQPGGFARQTHQDMGLSASPHEVVKARRREDKEAISTLGADTFWLDHFDAIYRGVPPYYQNNEALFGQVDANDFSLDEQLGTFLLEVYRRAPLATFYVPLGVGHHVDHQLCCSAGDRLAQQGANIKFYEDFPYVATPGALDTRRRELGSSLEAELVEVSGSLRLKEDALICYKSQIPVLFGSADKMQRSLEDYMGSLRRTYPGIEIERFWQFK